MNEQVEIILESWTNGQKKQAARQLNEAKDYDGTISDIVESEVWPESEKVKFFAYALKSQA